MIGLSSSHTNYLGMKGSLSVILAPEFERIRSSVLTDHVKLIVHEPDVLASSSVSEKNIAANAEVLVRVTTMVASCSEEVQQLPISDRGCIYDSERKLRFFARYREANCDLECKLLRIESLCKCLPYYFVSQVDEKKAPVCGFASIRCLVDNFCEFKLTVFSDTNTQQKNFRWLQGSSMAVRII